MGKVITVIKAYPQEGVDAQALAAEIRKLPECNSTKVVEIAFGAKAVMASFVCEDAEMKDYESLVASVKGVSEVQFEESGLL
jgi:translation elongation factor EF-1beta